MKQASVLTLLATIVLAMIVLAALTMGLLPNPSHSQVRARTLTLATTTSTVDSGLLDVLNPMFEARFNAKVKVVALGSGAALKVAENGDVDLVFVHARPAEDAFAQAGFGVNRRDVMFNDFVIVGPADDPAGVHGLDSAPEALARIAAVQAQFVSRGDDSGTHQKELSLWELSGVSPAGTWYLSVGRGMGNTLIQSSDLGAYTLSDRGTFLALRDKLNLEALVEGPVKGGDTRLLNPYGVIAVNPARFPSRNYTLAMAYIGFLTSPEAQQQIADFRVGVEPLFFPNALNEGPNFIQYLPRSPDR